MTPVTPTTDGTMRDALRLTALALAGAIVFAVATREPDDTHYYWVDELGDLASLEGKALKIHGWVVPGSIRHAMIGQHPVWSFAVQRKGQQLPVVYTGPMPDTVRDQSEVVLPGSVVPVDDEHVLAATEILAKCPSKYDWPAEPTLRYE